MLPELGQLCLILALGLALVQSACAFVPGRAGLLVLARPAAGAQLLFAAAAFGILARAFMVHDYSVAYVAANSNLLLPAFYRFAAVWGGHEGSLLLWTLIAAAWGAALAWRPGALDAALQARALGVMGLVNAGFLLFMVLTSNPFTRLAAPAADGADGRDLNPLLQDPGLVFHPPLLYAGYVGFAVAYACSVAALAEGRTDAAWLRALRPWTAAAWAFLTLGITLGSWWAYNELGWGGWWFWDPVENASFMPWLAGTALLHCLAVADRRGLFRSWCVLLAILAFVLSLLGTFLVRSGVLSSVHAFASDPGRGLFILALLAL
ncbi:MAG: heme lyase CcmF/NrfE family subunit, partial [Betaproteobacteria bacterium AqS2]|nr:heme lyase CcmF/NrfE family subunit [Betaproteobacteria bacterium AqS2]